MTGELLALFEEDDVIDEIKMIRAKVALYIFESFFIEKGRKARNFLIARRDFFFNLNCFYIN